MGRWVGMYNEMDISTGNEKLKTKLEIGRLTEDIKQLEKEKRILEDQLAEAERVINQLRAKLKEREGSLDIL